MNDPHEDQNSSWGDCDACDTRGCFDGEECRNCHAVSCPACGCRYLPEPHREELCPLCIAQSLDEKEREVMVTPGWTAECTGHAAAFARLSKRGLLSWNSRRGNYHTERGKLVAAELWCCDNCDRVGPSDTYVTTSPSSPVGEATLCASGHGCNKGGK